MSSENKQDLEQEKEEAFLLGVVRERCEVVARRREEAIVHATSSSKTLSANSVAAVNGANTNAAAAHRETQEGHPGLLLGDASSLLGDASEMVGSEGRLGDHTLMDIYRTRLGGEEPSSTIVHDTESQVDDKDVVPKRPPAVLAKTAAPDDIKAVPLKPSAVEADTAASPGPPRTRDSNCDIEVGAFSVLGPGNVTGSEEEDTNSISVVSDVSRGGDDEHEHLSEAFQVEEEEEEGFATLHPAAEEVDPKELERKMAQRQLKNKSRLQVGFGLLVLVLFAIVGVTLALTFGHDHSSSSSTPSAAPSMVFSESPSSAPTAALDLLLKGLPNYTLVSLQSIDTPQWKALDWLSRHPELSGMQEWRKKQLFALAAFYFAMEGPNWPQYIRDNWMLFSRHECFWFSAEFGLFDEGIYQQDSAYNMTPCTHQQEFQSLVLRDLELSSYNSIFIPPEIALLTSLATLSLPLNGINVSLSDFMPNPQMYTQMTNLTRLSFKSNSIPGSLPSELGLMTGMENLALYSNPLTGSIPSELGLMTSLTKLYLYSTRLDGRIPSELPLKMKNMADLALYDNELTGPIPSTLGLMSKLTQLYLFSNNLNGTIPSELGAMANMQELALYYNGLTGPIPSELGLMSSNMKRLFLYNNKLSGMIPSELGMMSTLTLLSLDDNTLTGQIPTELGLMSSTTDLYLYSNTLSGRIPTELGLMPSTTDLFLFGNSLSGPIPTELGMLGNMTSLRLESNALTGTIPSQLALMPKLEDIRLHNNSLTGTIPHELNSLALNASLGLFMLESNNITGTISQDLCSLLEYSSDFKLGLSFDCSDQLCGCCWCPCQPAGRVEGSPNTSTSCDTHKFRPSKSDEEWPGLFPTPFNSSNSVTINIRTDDYPEETSWEWSQLYIQDDTGSWEALDLKDSFNANSIYSHTKQVESGAIYRLRLSDSAGDGTCCGYGLGWFTVTTSIPSSPHYHAEGTCIWKATGNAMMSSLDVFFWINSDGYAQHVVYIPGLGYALMLDDESAKGGPTNIVVPEMSMTDSNDK